LNLRPLGPEPEVDDPWGSLLISTDHFLGGLAPLWLHVKRERTREVGQKRDNATTALSPTWPAPQWRGRGGKTVNLTDRVREGRFLRASRSMVNAVVDALRDPD